MRRKRTRYVAFYDLLVPVNNSKEVTTALKELIEDETLRKTMGKNAKRTVNSKFSEREIIENYIFYIQT